MNIEKVPSSTELYDTESTDLSAYKSKLSISEIPSTEYKLVPFFSLDNSFIPPRLKIVSPLSVTETERII